MIYTIRVFQDTKGKWRWHLRAPNGKLFAEGGQGYSRRQHALRAVHAVTTAMLGAVIE